LKKTFAFIEIANLSSTLPVSFNENKLRQRNAIFFLTALAFITSPAYDYEQIGSSVKPTFVLLRYGVWEHKH